MLMDRQMDGQKDTLIPIGHPQYLWGPNNDTRCLVQYMSEWGFSISKPVSHNTTPAKDATTQPEEQRPWCYVGAAARAGYECVHTTFFHNQDT